MNEIQRVVPEQLDQLSERQMRRALTFYYCTPTSPHENPGWYVKFVDSYPERVADVLVQCATAMIRAGNEHIPGLYELAHVKNHARLPVVRACLFCELSPYDVPRSRSKSWTICFGPLYNMRIESPLMRSLVASCLARV